MLPSFHFQLNVGLHDFQVITFWLYGHCTYQPFWRQALCARGVIFDREVSLHLYISSSVSTLSEPGLWCIREFSQKHQVQGRNTPHQTFTNTHIHAKQASDHLLCCLRHKLYLDISTSDKFLPVPHLNCKPLTGPTGHPKQTCLLLFPHWHVSVSDRPARRHR